MHASRGKFTYRASTLIVLDDEASLSTYASYAMRVALWHAVKSHIERRLETQHTVRCVSPTGRATVAVVGGSTTRMQAA